MKLFNVKRFDLTVLLVSNVHYDRSRRKGTKCEEETVRKKKHYTALCTGTWLRGESRCAGERKPPLFSLAVQVPS